MPLGRWALAPAMHLGRWALALGSVCVVTATDEAATCAAGGGEACGARGGARSDQYYWPHAQGRVGSYGRSPHVGPGNLSTASHWSWHHPEGRWTAIFFGVVIDDKKNLYVTSDEALRKFSPDGSLLWTYPCHSSASPALMAGVAFASDRAGRLHAVDMESGAEVWSTQVTAGIGSDSSAVGAHDGVVVTAGGAHGGGSGNSRVYAVDAASGKALWEMRPDAQLWVFVPLFTNNGTLVFQDQTGGVYHTGLRDGRLIWKSGYNASSWDETWVDGWPTILDDETVLAVHLPVPIYHLGPRVVGDLSAYRLSDGNLLWRRSFPLATNTQPLLVPRRKGDGLLVVMPVGTQANPIPTLGMGETVAIILIVAYALKLGLVLGVVAAALVACCSRSGTPARRRRCLLALAGVCAATVALGLALHFPPGWSPVWTKPWPAELHALDARTGEPVWTWKLPTWNRSMIRGDAEFYLYGHFWTGSAKLCWPTPFGSGAVDADGTLYIGYQDGLVYAIRDWDGDDHIDTRTEVSTKDVGCAFNIEGAALAPGMMAVTSCNGLHVFTSGA